MVKSVYLVCSCAFLLAGCTPPSPSSAPADKTPVGLSGNVEDRSTLQAAAPSGPDGAGHSPPDTLPGAWRGETDMIARSTDYIRMTFVMQIEPANSEGSYPISLNAIQRDYTDPAGSNEIKSTSASQECTGTRTGARIAVVCRVVSSVSDNYAPDDLILDYGGGEMTGTLVSFSSGPVRFTRF